MAGHCAQLVELRAAWEREREAATAVDAVGLPVIGVAIVLSGLPDAWVELWWVGWLLIAIAVIVAAAAWTLSRRK